MIVCVSPISMPSIRCFVISLKNLNDSTTQNQKTKFLKPKASLLPIRLPMLCAHSARHTINMRPMKLILTSEIHIINGTLHTFYLRWIMNTFIIVYSVPQIVNSYSIRLLYFMRARTFFFFSSLESNISRDLMCARFFLFNSIHLMELAVGAKEWLLW